MKTFEAAKIPFTSEELLNMKPGAVIPPTITPKEVSIVKRGEAIASVRALEETVEAQAREIATLQRRLQTCQDRLDLAIEDRHKWRADADAYRVALVELSSDMHNLHLLTERSSATREKILAIIARDPPPETEAPKGFNGPAATTTDVLRSMEHTLAPQAETTLPPVSSSEPPPVAGQRSVEAQAESGQ